MQSVGAESRRPGSHALAFTASAQALIWGKGAAVAMVSKEECNGAAVHVPTIQ